MDQGEAQVAAQETTKSGVEHSEPESGPLLPPGTRVEVRNRFDRSWCRGFEVAGVEPDGYRLRRLSDGRTLPSVFAPEDVREERRSRRMMWWY
ncbi:MAG: hypothetical protein KatS3mg008_1953 [Acidimicrobiales bacterium]|nr:MAG: hypothetical protein KatS3mg008_1953 [Acidimicrobiales bacterium]